MIKKWKITEKNENGAKKRQMRWNPKNAKNLEFFFSFFLFLFYHFFHFSVLCSEPLDFAKCSSLFPNFLVENAAKHKKSMKRTKNMMRNE